MDLFSLPCLRDFAASRDDSPAWYNEAGEKDGVLELGMNRLTFYLREGAKGLRRR